MIWDIRWHFHDLGSLLEFRSSAVREIGLLPVGSKNSLFRILMYWNFNDRRVPDFKEKKNDIANYVYMTTTLLL